MTTIEIMNETEAPDSGTDIESVVHNPTFDNIRRLSETTTVFLSVNGELVNPSAYRSNYNDSLSLAYKGYGVDDSILKKASGASATAYACIQYIADTAKNLPLYVGNVAEQEVDYHPFFYFLNDAPIILRHTITSLLVYGCAHLVKWRNPTGFPTRLQYVENMKIEKRPSRTGHGFEWWVEGNKRGNYDIYRPRDVIEIVNPEFSDKKSPLHVALMRIIGEQSIVKHSVNVFENSARPDGMLIYKGAGKLKPTEMEKAKSDWKAFKGVSNAGSTFVQTGEWEFHPMTIPPVDLAMTELSGEIAEDICKIFNVNPALVGTATTSDPLSAQNTFKAIKRDHIESNSIPMLEGVIFPALAQQWLWTDFTEKGYYTLYVATNEIAVLSDATSENVTTANALAESGVGTLDESRQLLGLGKRDGEYMVNDPTKPLLALQGSGITLNQFLGMVGLPKLSVNGDVVFYNGQVLPRKRLNEIAQSQADHLINPPEPVQPNDFALSVAREVRTVIERELMNLTNLKDIVGGLVSQTGDPTIRAVPETRRDGTIEISIELNNNAFIRQALRNIEEQFATTDNVTWVSPERWRIVLATVAGASPTDASKLLSLLDFEDETKISLTADNYSLDDGGLSVSIQQNKDLSKLQTQVALAVDELGYTAETPRNFEILLAYVPDGVTLREYKAISYPLVANNTSVSYDGTRQHKWDFRGIPQSQLTELRNWKLIAKKNIKADRDTFFRANALRGQPIVGFVRWALRMGYDPTLIFEEAHAILAGERDAVIANDVTPIRIDEEAEFDVATPNDVQAYWENYDDLQAELASDWTNEYMNRAFRNLKPLLGEQLPNHVIIDALRTEHDELRDEWIGTRDAFGVIPKLILAGMGAGNNAIINNMPADYRGVIRAIDVTTNWDKMSNEAYSFAQSYSYELIRGIDMTTAKLVRKAHTKWLKDGGSLSDFEKSIEQIFGDPIRAKRIAQTESTRAYNRGAEQRYQSVGVREEQWQTVNDGRVCPICLPLHGKKSPVGAGTRHDGGTITNKVSGEVFDTNKHSGKTFKKPAHVGCRCFSRPVISKNAELKDLFDLDDLPEIITPPTVQKPEDLDYTNVYDELKLTGSRESTASESLRTWGTTHFKSHWKSFDEKNHDGVRNYTGGNYSLINGHLRGKQTWDDFDRRFGGTVKQIDLAMERSKLSTNLILYRGLRDFDTRYDDLFSGKIGAGSILMDKGFFSSSIDRSVAWRFAGYSNAIRITLLARANMNAVWCGLDGSSESGNVRYQHPSENEVLFPRNSRYRVLSVSVTEKGKPIDVRGVMLTTGELRMLRNDPNKEKTERELTDEIIQASIDNYDSGAKFTENYEEVVTIVHADWYIDEDTDDGDDSDN